MNYNTNLKAHGYIESDGSDSGCSCFDEEYEKIKPPPIPFRDIQDKVFVLRPDSDNIVPETLNYTQNNQSNLKESPKKLNKVHKALNSSLDNIRANISGTLPKYKLLDEDTKTKNKSSVAQCHRNTDIATNKILNPTSHIHNEGPSSSQNLYINIHTGQSNLVVSQNKSGKQQTNKSKPLSANNQQILSPVSYLQNEQPSSSRTSRKSFAEVAAQRNSTVSQNNSHKQQIKKNTNTSLMNNQQQTFNPSSYLQSEQPSSSRTYQVAAAQGNLNVSQPKNENKYLSQKQQERVEVGSYYEQQSRYEQQHWYERQNWLDQQRVHSSEEITRRPHDDDESDDSCCACIIL